LTQVCGERASGIASLPLERIERAVQPDGGQRSALKELQDATAQAVNLLSSDCPTYRALTPVCRLQAMEERLDAMLRAVQTVQPALVSFSSADCCERGRCVPAMFGRFASLQLMKSLAVGRTIANMTPPPTVPQITEADT